MVRNLIAVSITVAMLALTPGCTSARTAARECNSACISSWNKWVKGGAGVGGPTGTGYLYCTDHPDEPLCDKTP